MNSRVFGYLLKDATEVSSWDDEYETALMDWHRLCVTELAGVSHTCNVWLLFAVTLHTKQVGLSSSDKDNRRIAILAQLQNNHWACKGLLRMTPASFNGLCATSSMSHSRRHMHERIIRRLDVNSMSSYLKFGLTHHSSQSQNYTDASDGQSYPKKSDKDHNAPHSRCQHSSGKGKCRKKFNEAKQSVLEKASDKMLLGMEKMCTAVMTSAKQSSRIDGDRNVKVFEELEALDLRRPYLIRCYKI